LKNLQTYDEPAFLAWYAPWEAEMKADPLCRFFNTLRSAILKDVEPQIGIRPSSPAGVAGEVIVDLPMPTSHKGEPIHDPTLQGCCELYVEYLQGMVTSATPLIQEVQERWHAAQGD
jgi:hypothetical protein